MDEYLVATPQLDFNIPSNSVLFKTTRFSLSSLCHIFFSFPSKSDDVLKIVPSVQSRNVEFSFRVVRREG